MDFLASAGGVRIITRKPLAEAVRQKPPLAASIGQWLALVDAEDFPHFAALRRRVPLADQVRVASGRTVTIFNLARGHRLITAIHYNHRKIFILAVLDHDTYEEAQWKLTL